jgi:hypothetical protein
MPADTRYEVQCKYVDSKPSKDVGEINLKWLQAI